MSLKSWVESANDLGTDFPLQNLPFGVFQAGGPSTIGVAIGDRVLDLRGCARAGLFDSLPFGAKEACGFEALNSLMSLGLSHWSALRARLIDLLTERRNEGRVEASLYPMHEVAMQLPALIGDYSDFYASIDHARNVGSLFRPDNPLLPNYKYVPIGYHGRASSLVVSGTPIRRPWGQTKEPSAEMPLFGPTRSLDYEVEVGLFVGRGNTLGEPIPVEEAESQIFGLCLVNDWSARDIQAWEYQPLGPFLGKSFATTVSPWIVPMDALRPFRVPAVALRAGDPAPLPYLYADIDQRNGGIDLNLEVFVCSRRMREIGDAPLRLSRSNLRDLYWTLAQLVTHHASNGCNLRPGDLLASGTVSGPTRDALGSLLELTRRGTEPVRLPTGELRGFLEDGDEVSFRGYCERDGFARIGFGECRGIVCE